jgi:hypothetical protein
MTSSCYNYSIGHEYNDRKQNFYFFFKQGRLGFACQGMKK